jgi:hypothetical protein
MKVNVQYFDNTSLTVESIVKQAEHNYGKLAHVEVTPESMLAYDHIYFGLQQLLTHEQVSLLFEKNKDYHNEVTNLRNKVLAKVADIADQVIMDNEAKVTT